MTTNYKEVVEQSRIELRQKVAERTEVDRRISELRAALRALIKFFPEAEREQVIAEIKNAKRPSGSLSDAILEILSQPENKRGMSSNQIRTALEESGFDLDDYSQPLAAVMTTLQRLAENDKVVRDLLPHKEAGKPGAVLYKITAAGRLKKADGD